MVYQTWINLAGLIDSYVTKMVKVKKKGLVGSPVIQYLDKKVAETRPNNNSNTLKLII